jgi:hypothetical protein
MVELDESTYTKKHNRHAPLCENHCPDSRALNIGISHGQSEAPARNLVNVWVGDTQRIKIHWGV